MSRLGHFVWYDHWTNDLKAAEAFYTNAIGWGTQQFGSGPEPYVMWVAGDRPMGGFGKVPPAPDGSQGHPLWAGFIAVDDADATATRARQLGGEIVTPGTDIPGVGRFAVIRDPQGALVAVLSSSNPDPGEPPDLMAPQSVCWHELHTTDQEAAGHFYSELFGWQRTETLDMGADGPYVMYRHPEAPEGRSFGAMFEGATRKGMPAHWLYYFNVDAIEPALARIRAGGGRVLEGPMEVPGGGRIAPCLDPQGAAFAVFSLK